MGQREGKGESRTGFVSTCVQLVGLSVVASPQKQAQTESVIEALNLCARRAGWACLQEQSG